VGSSVHTRRVLSWMGESDLTRIRMAAATRVPLFSFTDDERELALEAFERIDDVIMGGVSSSRLVLANDDAGGALFEGRLREQGGGFCGTRMKLLAEPLDLSAASGLYLEIDASGTEASSRVWKVAVRTRQDRGEVVYQRAFKPSAIGRERVFLPFDEFRLVRGPRLVPGVPPLSASQANETFQISLVVSKFEVSETGAALPSFREGPFCLRVFEIGSFAAAKAGAGPDRAERASARGASPTPMPRALTEAEQKAQQPLPLKLLRPVIGLLFGETSRRRRAATLLLQARNTTALGRMRLAWAWRAGGSAGVFGAARKTTAVLLRDMAALVLTVPARLLFKTVVTSSRALKWAKAKLGGGSKDAREEAVKKVRLS